MPIYEYRCASCGRTVELLQRVDDPPAKECSDCGGGLEKLFSAPSFQFKGSGWYVTDYARKAAAGSDGKDAGSGDQGSTTDSDSQSGAAETTASEVAGGSSGS